MFDTLYRTTYRTRKFREIFPQEAFDNAEVTDYNNFRWWYENCGFPCKVTSKPTSGTDYLKVLYIALLSKYGESHISSQNEPRFRLEVMRIIFQWGALWEKELEIQDKIRELDIDAIINGSKVVNAHSYNDSTEVSIDDAFDNEIPLNEVNTTVWRKDPTEAYAKWLALLDEDVTEKFLNRFKKLFATFASEMPIIYHNCEVNEDEE